YRLFESLFGLDDESKRKYERPETGRQRGYTSFGVEHAKGHEKADLKEFWHVGRELPAGHPLARRMPRNEWPSEIEDFRTKTMAIYTAMDTCAQHLLEAISVYLGEAPNALPDMAKDGNSVLRVIHYPVCDGF